MHSIKMAIDPSSTSFAVVVEMPDRSIFYRKYELTTKNSPMTCGYALRIFTRLIRVTLPLNNPNPDWPWEKMHKVAFIEAPIVGRGGVHSTMVQAFLNGILQGVLVSEGYEVELVHPGTWKKALVGKGNAEKADVVRVIRRRWPTISTGFGDDQDLFDAAGILLARTS